ncbi:MAG TPA: HEAT repeat domain-containing protein [Candidatus Angelobacter sp.]|nr:HEAT repeat domain-containing protein [Candidatus Angelobacter sp.]
MAQPSKAGPVVLTLFALPFLGGGLFFLYAQFTSRQNSRPNDAVIGAAIASFFVFVGGGLILASIKGYGLLKKQSSLQDANPTSPWLWRTDWASRRAESQDQKSYIGAWILAALGNLFLFPFMFGMVPQLLRHSDPRAIIVLAFASLGVILTVRAIRATIRHERFGNSYFEFDSLPFSLGQRATGRIHLKFETQAAHGIDLRLTCVRRVVTGSGKSQSTSNITLWQADKNVPSGALAPGPLGRAIPVDFELSADGLQTDHNNSSDQILWLLHAQADVPGVDYSDDFELPVFRTADSPQPSSDASSPAASPAGSRIFGFASVPSIDGDSGAVPQPAHTKVVVSMHDGGTEFYFPPFRTPGRALLLFVVSAIFSGAVYLMLHSKVPLFFTAVFALSDLFILFGFFHVAFGSPHIFVGNGEIRSRGGLLGFGSPRRTPFSEIASIVPVASLQQGGGTDNSVYIIRLITKAGKKFTLADEISSRQEARWVVSQIETLAGLKLDTHVEVDLPLGVPAQPPQLRSAAIQTTPQATKLALVFCGMFTALCGGFFAWQARNIFANTARARSARAAAAPRSAPATPRVFHGPMTDSDVARVLALPPQDQAEELLERAIAHDAKALSTLSEYVAGWTGQLHHTPRMDQLVQRSQYSKDLRVRLANLDVSLALEGWQENEDAVTSLITRADSDPQHRAWALYYLGMLAGRGVAYDRIHPILLGYARNDPDATVRQWAVEGLRFLGKDEVLDELYTSFTEDPAMSVRDRAGCNISDCGIFTRKQRMRMVPQLIDLAAHPGTNPQMRNWCFLALQEITDENQPADALAWNRWYVDHGAEKMAAFERLEWWQVRGDE